MGNRVVTAPPLWVWKCRSRYCNPGRSPSPRAPPLIRQRGVMVALDARKQLTWKTPRTYVCIRSPCFTPSPLQACCAFRPRSRPPTFFSSRPLVTPSWKWCGSSKTWARPTSTWFYFASSVKRRLMNFTRRSTVVATIPSNSKRAP